jgi:hypothetical protein
MGNMNFDALIRRVDALHSEGIFLLLESYFEPFSHRSCLVKTEEWENVPSHSGCESISKKPCTMVPARQAQKEIVFTRATVDRLRAKSHEQSLL